MRTQLNVRLPEHTIAQINELAAEMDESQAHVIIIAVDRLRVEMSKETNEMFSKLGNAIKAKINESNDPNSSGTINFNWNKADKTWCMSGSTKSGLYFETDDVEADNIKDARAQMIEHLEA